MKVLITGSEGQVGRALAVPPFEKGGLVGISTLPYSRTQLDITDFSAIARVMQKERPDVIVNTAAFTAVDRAEHEYDAAMAVNRDGAGYLALACEAAGIPLIHLSTDYVFDGHSSTPYTEEDVPAPCNKYGMSKWEGEEAVRRLCRKHVILRVSGVFSATSQNFVKTILRLAKEREVLRVVDDQMLCPTSADAIAGAIMAVLGKSPLTPPSILHYASTEPVSWYAFACAIVEIARQYQPLRVQRIEPITSQAYAAPAQRPQYSVLECRRYDNLIGGVRPSWRVDLKSVIAQLMGSGLTPFAIRSDPHVSTS